MRKIISFLLFTFVVTFGQKFITVSDEMEISGKEMHFDNNTGLITAKGDVHFKSGSANITGDHAIASQKTKDFWIGGNVKMTQGDDYWEGKDLRGNTNEQSLYTKDFDVKAGAFYIVANRTAKLPSAKDFKGESIRFPKFHEKVKDKNGKFIASEDDKAENREVFSKKLAGHTIIRNAKFTTCDFFHHGEEHFTMTAKKIVIKPDGYMTAYHVVLRIDGFPVMYFPILFTSYLKGVPNSELRVGYESRFGAFIKTTYNMAINDNIMNQVFIDYYTKRGLGFGDKLNINTLNHQTELFAYWIKDNDAPDTNDQVPGLPPDDGKEYNKRYYVTDERYRLKFKHKSKLTENFDINASIDKLSDIDMLEDWFRKEFFDINQPSSRVSANYLNENFGMSLQAIPQLNDFYNVVERKPEFQLDIYRRRLGNSNIYYQGHFNFADLEMNWSKLDGKYNYNNDYTNYKSQRFDTMHTFYMPMKYNNWLNIIPRAGVRFTHYSESSKIPMNDDRWNAIFDLANYNNVFGRIDADKYDKLLAGLTDYDANELGDAINRLTGEIGFEMTFKKYKTWSEYKNESLGLDGLRHIVEPYINWTSIIKPTEDKEKIYYFDEIDRIDELNFLRVGARQIFQTRRNQKLYTFASIENYADFHATTRDDIKRLGNFGTRITYSPTEKVDIYGRLLVGMDNLNFNELELGASYTTDSKFTTAISYLYRDEYQHMPAYSMNSYLEDFSTGHYFARKYGENHSLKVIFGFPINAKTSGKIEYLFDILEGDLVAHYYEINYDLHCWIAAFRIGWDDGSFVTSGMLYLKALREENYFKRESFANLENE